MVVAHNIYPKKGEIRKTPDRNLLMIFLLTSSSAIRGVEEDYTIPNTIGEVEEVVHSLPLLDKKAINSISLGDEEEYQRKNRKQVVEIKDIDSEDDDDEEEDWVEENERGTSAMGG
ncbi:uncharacterized protein A4U43_C06F18210 [Asparagus officinalis]|uniref:Uncharacterized protein n=1 Tax=Asparagus officinalis TaxID=4686 RepID=A0A5P1EMM6_ASPOF|nr:uncharacterized protein A4U43_C06F18210 [Asparagus officinalis]